MKRICTTGKLLLGVCAILLAGFSNAQTGVLNPNDPIVVYNKNAPPATPPFGTLAKWVKTNRLPWNTSSFKCYFYKGYAFRLKFPKTYQPGVADGKTYPVFVFFHGTGEKGTIYDNEYQLYHGGQVHSDAVDNGKFDGYLLYLQSTGDGWSNSAYDVINELIQKYMVPEVKVDPFRIYADGLSSGGGATWTFLIRYPKLVAAALPISSTVLSDSNSIPIYKYTPIWHFQGGLDDAPWPATSRQLGAAILRAGGNYRYTEYPDKNHGCWNAAWAEPDYFPFMLRANKVNPWPLFGRTEFCSGEAINVTLGVTAGFTGYEWRKDGVVISGANGNTLQATQPGTYDCRINTGTAWSYWSPTPVVISIKAATATPDIKVSGLASKVIPAPDGSTGVPLELPDGYTSYLWQKEGSSTTVSTTRFYTATTPGNYRAQVTEQYGCSSNFSNWFTVVNANGPNPPDAPFNVVATPTSKKAIKVTWSQTSAPAYNETNFEVYQSPNSSSGPYKLVAITAANATSYRDSPLTEGVTYYYKLRAVNNTAASAVTTPVSGTTPADILPPTAPGSLRTGVITQTSIELIWNASTDDVKVQGYDVYINNVKSYYTTKTSFIVYGLKSGTSYQFIVRAKDPTGNVSAPSNLLTAQPASTGLSYKYYQGSWQRLPDFTTLVPKKIGSTPNVTLAPKLRTEKFAFYWEGNITIPVSGTYTFKTNSDDGSKIYLNTPYQFKAAALVNNDGVHDAKDATGTVTLNAGSYPIVITYFQYITGSTMSVSWLTPQTNGNYTLIPDSVFSGSSADTVPIVPNTNYVMNININDGSASAPAQPSPWNNTNSFSYNGLILRNLLTDKGNPTGVDWTVTSSFDGFTASGATTGNNSGVFPDNVMKSSWFMDPSDTGVISITNLKLSDTYRFVFFGSRAGVTDTRTAFYQIGTQSVSLNCTNNLNTVQLDNIKPDNTGTVVVKVYGAPGSLSYLNAMSIQSIKTGTGSKSTQPTQPLQQVADALNGALKTKISAYPSPFINDVVLQLDLKKDVPQMNVVVTNMQGNLVYAETFKNVQKGKWQQKLNLGRNTVLYKGVYLLQVNGIPGEMPLSIKLIK